MYVLLENDEGYRIAYFSRDEDGEIYGTFAELLGYLGIGLDRFVKITEPSLFAKVIVPEPSMGYAFEFCAEKYRLVVDKVKERALASSEVQNLSPVKRIYFTRMNFSSTDVGEKEIAECFEKNGFRILSPERLSLAEQIFYISNADEIASVSGTIPHNFIFANPTTRLIYLNRNPLPNYAQFRINYIFGLSPVWIDVYNRRCLKGKLGHNMFFRIWIEVSDCLKKFLRDYNMLMPTHTWISYFRNYIRYKYIWDIHPVLWKTKMYVLRSFRIKRVKIVVSYHKKDFVPKNTMLFPIHSGKKLSSLSLDFLGDDTGNNISALNTHFCELTAMYWAWKNLKNVDITGLFHYRRYICLYPYLSLNSISLSDYHFQKYSRINFPFFWLRDLKKYDIILPHAFQLGEKTVREQYLSSHHISEHLDIVKQVINEQCSEYLPAFDELMQSHSFHICNMFVSNWTTYDGLCSWLFPLLFEVDRRIDYSNLNTYEQRVIGFLSERLINVYILHNKLKVKGYSMITNDKPDSDSILLQDIKAKKWILSQKIIRWSKILFRW